MNVFGHRWPGRIEVTHPTVRIAGEDGDGRVLVTLFVLTFEVVLEATVAGAEQPQVLPAAIPTVGAQRRKIGRRHDGKVHVLPEVLSDTVESIDPHGAHRAGWGLLLSVHEVVDEERTVRAAEELAQPYMTSRPITGVEVGRSFLEDIVLDGWPGRQVAAHFGDLFLLAHQFELGDAEVLTAGQVVRRLVREPGVAHAFILHTLA